LLRLRGEVAVLRATTREQTNEANPAPSSSFSDRLISSDQFADVGFSTPASTLQTICWAAFTLNKQRYQQAIVWGDDAIKTARENQKEGFDASNIFFTVSNPDGHTRAFELLEVQQVTPDHQRATVLVVRGDENSESREKRHMELINVNGEWKWLVPSPADVGIIPFTP
jgi:hypothetical protein